jgi:hypothetical protein
MLIMFLELALPAHARIDLRFDHDILASKFQDRVWDGLPKMYLRLSSHSRWHIKIETGETKNLT